MFKKEERNPLIAGRHPLLEALKARKGIEKIFVQKGAHGDSLSDILRLAREMEVPVQYVPSEKLKRMYGGNHQGVLAFSSLVEYQDINNIIPFLFEQGEMPLILVLDGITDVRNLGAIARTALGTGVHAILVSAHDQAPINPIAIKTSAGALNRIPVCRHKNLHAILETMKLSGIRLFAAASSQSTPLSEVDFNIPCAIVMGAEGSGVSQGVLDICDEQMSIPILNELDSYNVSVAAGMILYESMLQRKGLRK
jgi:23S rRNA (guanosine2251-2'-O)-methyltransferase